MKRYNCIADGTRIYNVDGDNHCSKVLNGLSKKEVKQIKKVTSGTFVITFCILSNQVSCFLFLRVTMSTSILSLLLLTGRGEPLIGSQEEVTVEANANNVLVDTGVLNRTAGKNISATTNF